MLRHRERSSSEDSEQSASHAAPCSAAWAEAIERLRADGGVAFPTETVWGLAFRANSDRALVRLRAWKGRARVQPISLLVSGEEALARHGFVASELTLRLVRAFWPGPLTLVLPTRVRFASGIARGDGAVGLRCSPHPLAAALVGAAERAGLGLLTATSLNHSGRPAAGCEREARLLCGAEPGQPLVLAADGPDAGGVRPSSVLDLCAARPVLLRAGAISIESIESIAGKSIAEGRAEPALEPGRGERA